MVLRLLTAFAASGMLGNNRHRSDKPAGFRTHVLVGLGSCMVMLTSIHMAYAFVAEIGWQPDPARIAAQVVTGIGFLGAGTILHHGATVRGLTTAATLWAAACIGLAAGAGLYGLTAAVTVLMMLSITVLDRVQGRAITRRSFRIVKLTCLTNEASKAFDKAVIPSIETVITRYGKTMRNLELKTNKGDKGRVVVQFDTEFYGNEAMLASVEELQALPFVESVTMES